MEEIFKLVTFKSYKKDTIAYRTNLYQEQGIR
jgi:hypothetical protein